MTPEFLLRVEALFPHIEAGALSFRQAGIQLGYKSGTKIRCAAVELRGQDGYAKMKKSYNANRHKPLPVPIPIEDIPPVDDEDDGGVAELDFVHE